MALGKDNQIVHRAGPLKQANKAHKSGRSRDKKQSKGKVHVKKLTQHKRQDLKRIARKNRLQQLRKVKRDEVIMQKRGLGSSNSAPILGVVLSLDEHIDARKFVADLQHCDDDIIVTNSKLGTSHLSFPRLKQRFSFIVPNRHNIHYVMDALKVADVLLLLHPHHALDEFTENLLSVIIGHALPTAIHVVQGMDKMNPKKKAECRKNILKIMESRFSDEKLHSADTRQELQLLLRQVGCQKRRPVGFRDSRSYLLAENAEHTPSETDAGSGTLKVSGFVHGQPLSVNGLVHIPGWGDFQLSQIDYETDPYPVPNKATRCKSGEDVAMNNTVIASDKADATEQASLQSEVVPDPMEGEQTWPTKEELDAAALKPKKSKKRVTEGTSEYQATWIVDSESESCSDSESEDGEEDEADSMSEGESNMDEDMEETESVADMKDDNYDKNINLEEEKEMLVRFKEERLNEMFPDELDTPHDSTARVRFQKYRGLKNFSGSPWDPMENLPTDYSRIYRFDNFKQTKKRVLNSEKDGAPPGSYVTLHIKNVPKPVYDSIEESQPFIVYSLLKHEQKMSILNVVIRRHHTCKSSIKSKDTLVFHIGYKRFTCRPIFSEHKTGNKFKYERFLPRDTAVVASFYAPVIFPPASVVVFKQSQEGTHELVATGNVLDVNPNRIVVKRIVLSGHAFKIYKKLAVVRYMFFNKEDINWFKCVELRTKRGRRGHIKEYLGSHGHMKCIFDKQLQSQDVVLMNLYKRVFPKWTFDSYVPTPNSSLLHNKTVMEEM